MTKKTINKLQHNHSPNVSIVMPVYNGPCTLMEDVDSVLKQTYQDFELIICNDASTDETPNLLNTITDQRFRVIHNHHNLGPAPTRNYTIDMAHGDWIAVINAECMVPRTAGSDAARGKRIH